MLWGAKHWTRHKSFLQDGWLCLVNERVDCRIRKPCRNGYIHPTLLLRLREPAAWKERCNEALGKTHFRLEAWVWKRKCYKTRSLRVILQRSICCGKHNSEQVLSNYWRDPDKFLSFLFGFFLSALFCYGLLRNIQHTCDNHTNWSSKSGRLHHFHCAGGKGPLI